MRANLSSVSNPATTSRWFSRKSSRFFALCWMLMVHMALCVPTIFLASVSKAASMQPNYETQLPSWSVRPAIVMGDYAAPGVRGVYIKLVDSVSGRSILFNIGTFYETNFQQSTYIPWDNSLHPLPPGHPFLDSPGFTLVGTSSGTMSGIIAPATSLTFSASTFAFSYAGTHFYSGTDGLRAIFTVANDQSAETIDDWFANALENEALPSTLPVVRSTYQMCVILEAIGLGLAIVTGVGSIFACQNDSVQQASIGHKGCGAAYGLSAPVYCQTCYEECNTCVTELFKDDNINCLISAGLNGPDGDQATCATGCACP